MGTNDRNAVVIFEFEYKNRSTPTALAHGAAIMRDPRVRVLIYGKAFPTAAGHALMFVVYERPAAWQAGQAAAAGLVATAAYDVGEVPLSARSKRQWEAGVPQVNGAGPFLPSFLPAMWQRLVPVVVPAVRGVHSKRIDGWTMPGVPGVPPVVVVPTRAAAAAGAPNALAPQLPNCNARVAGVNATAGIVRIASATLRGGAGAENWRAGVCANQLNIDLLQVAARYSKEARNKSLRLSKEV